MYSFFQFRIKLIIIKSLIFSLCFNFMLLHLWGRNEYRKLERVLRLVTVSNNVQLVSTVRNACQPINSYPHSVTIHSTHLQFDSSVNTNDGSSVMSNVQEHNTGRILLMGNKGFPPPRWSQVLFPVLFWLWHLKPTFIVVSMIQSRCSDSKKSFINQTGKGDTLWSGKHLWSLVQGLQNTANQRNIIHNGSQICSKILSGQKVNR